ncbi:neuronal acetylcholine receptor subunit non-alpha-2-like [Onthophagus taurus]|uniref:neuronal acetylcholine receptor subunit non-alpha-2-like n=1 Tax=Onthophagus taurus TaxID=166361 RepID=UPI000C200114|nr:neuronal acetylcholine receptor subunit non-alpha-2-like [Onthophagus taurus]
MFMTKICIFITITIVVISIFSNYLKVMVSSEWCMKSSKQAHSRLKDDVLCDYDLEIRPKLNHTVATVISVKMILKSFSFDMHSHYLSLNAWATFFWADDHLQWDPEDYDGIKSTTFPVESLWIPDISHYNRYEQDGNHEIISNVNCYVVYNGKVACVSPGKYDTLCTADLKYYPYDRQTCSFVIGSWMYSGEEVDLQFFNDPINMEELTQNPEWKLINVTYTRNSGEDSCCPNSTFPSLIYTFVIERRGEFFEATAVIPALGLILMTLLILTLEAKESERITLIVCDIISHIIYLHYISWNVPSFGDNVPKIILFGRDSLVIVFFVLMITVILRNITKSPETSPNWANDYISKALESRLGHMVLVLDFTMKNIAKIKREEDGENIVDNVQRNVEKDCNLFAKFVDRLCVVLISFTYLLLIILFLL